MILFTVVPLLRIFFQASELMWFLFPANENRYEGLWKDDKKHGEGKFFYLNKGQLYTGVWVEDIAKCGTMEDFGRDGAPEPTVYPIPKVGVFLQNLFYLLPSFTMLLIG